MKTTLLIALCIIGLNEWSTAQTVTQTIKGKVIDQTSQEELLGVNVILLDSNPIVGTTTGMDGTFVLENVPVGRKSLEFRMIGYESYFATEILITSGKEVVFDVNLKEEVTNLDEIVVTFKADKDKAINEMATVSSRQFTVEETQRYAGGLSDPARLVSSFAGVATPSISSNGISIRGNSPSGLLWRIEGVEVPSPNHFADLSIAGAGILTVLSSQVLGNSDFMTGAFPAEYGNATSGVFDMNLRRGNSTEREHTAQLGILGVDLATEGPFKKGSDATYLVNYRYSTLALIGELLPSDAGILKYQDLSYNIDLPTENAGRFSLWSIGAIDGINMEADDPSEWEDDYDRDNSQTSMYLYASGLNHRINLNPRALLNSSLAISGHGLSFKEQYLNNDLQALPRSDAKKNNHKLTLQSSLNSYLSDRHYNKTGFYINRLGYDLNTAHSDSPESKQPETIVDENGQSYLFQLYSQSQFELSPRLTLNAGFHSQYFDLNQDLTFEPRMSLKYDLSDKSNLGAAYGLHSKTESLGFYFVKDDLGNEPNKDLKLMNSHHWVLSYNSRLSDYIRLSIEPYYQYLTNVPVTPEGHVSILNTEDNLFFDETLVSNGTGRNLGIDFTLERYLNNGFYSLLTTSFFDSKYTANDGIERNTRLNKNYVINAVAGWEWQVGRNDNNTLSVNMRLNYLGGNRAEVIDRAASIDKQKVVLGETDGQLAFTQRHKDTPICSFTLSYRKNKPKSSSVWSLQVLNSNNAQEFDGYSFNNETQKVNTDYVGIMIPNLSYKIEF
ncbi:MAG: TonB-dependent receptor [Cyclobacteriaceae bacterium]